METGGHAKAGLQVLGPISQLQTLSVFHTYAYGITLLYLLLFHADGLNFVCTALGNANYFSDLKKKPNDVLGLRAIKEEHERRAQRLEIVARPASAASFGHTLGQDSAIQGHQPRATLPFCW